MAINYPWMEEAYKGVIDWNVSNSQQNPDRGAMKDALQASTAGKYVDYELSKGMIDQATQREKELMQMGADLDSRNASDLMAKEHQFNTEGMKLSSALSKDYLEAQTGSDIAKIGAQGEQSQKLQEVTNKGALDVAGVQAESNKYSADKQVESNKYNADVNKTVGLAQTEAQKYGADKQSETGKYTADAQKESSLASTAAQKEVGLADVAGRTEVAKIGSETSKYSQDAESARNTATLASQEKQIGLQGEAQKGIVQTQGEESRKGIAAEGEESRKSLAYDRAMSYQMARSGARR